MGIAFKANGATQTGTNTTVTVPWPAGHAAGDYAIMHLSSNPSTGTPFTAVNLQGFTTISSMTDTNNTLWDESWWLVATSGSMASPTISCDSTHHIVVTITTFSGAANVAPTQVGGNQNDGTTTIIFTGGTTTIPGCMFVMPISYGGTPPPALGAASNAALTGLALQYDVSASDSLNGSGLYSGVLAASGSWGNTNASLSGTGGWAALTFFIQPPTVPDENDSARGRSLARIPVVTGSRRFAEDDYPPIPVALDDSNSVGLQIPWLKLARPFSQESDLPSFALDDLYPRQISLRLLAMARPMSTGNDDLPGIGPCEHTHMPEWADPGGHPHMPEWQDPGSGQHDPEFDDPEGAAVHMPEFVNPIPKC